jgi:hypothetical protein
MVVEVVGRQYGRVYIGSSLKIEDATNKSLNMLYPAIPLLATTVVTVPLQL